MGERWRALRLLTGTAWRTDRWRSLALLLEPIGFLRFPLFAWCLKLMADGALSRDLRLLAMGAAGITFTRVLWFLGMWTGSWIRVELTERVGFSFDREIARLTAELPGVEHQERPDIQDRLELLRQKQGVLGISLNLLINAANAVVAGVGTLAALAFASPWLLLLVPFALPMVPLTARMQRRYRDAEQRCAEPGRRARHLRALTVDRNAGMELRVFGLQAEILARFRQAWTEAWRGILAVERRAAWINSAGQLLFMAGYVGAVGLMLWRAGRGLATAGEVVMNQGPEPWSEDELYRQLKAADAMMAFMPDRVDQRTLLNAPRLKTIACALKGYDNFDLKACSQAGVSVSFVPDLLTVPTAELTVGLIMFAGVGTGDYGLANEDISANVFFATRLTGQPTRKPIE